MKESTTHFSHIGETVMANCGQSMKIIAYKNYKNIDVEFEDGTVICSKTYAAFKKGQILNPNLVKSQQIGEVITAVNGQQMKIVARRSCRDIDVMFEDGTLVTGVEYSNFLKGNIKNPNFKYSSKYEVGSSYMGSNGITFTIIDKRHSNDIDIKFEDGTVSKHVKTGAISARNVRHPSINQRGYGVFCNFEVSRAFKDDNGVFYRCKCSKCGLEDIMTPQQMVKHYGLLHEEN